MTKCLSRAVVPSRPSIAEEEPVYGQARKPRAVQSGGGNFHEV